MRGGQGLADALGFGDVRHGRHPADLVAVGVQQGRHVHAGGEARAVAALRLDFQAATGRLAGHQHVQGVLVLFVAAGHPIREGRAAADQVGFVPADHAAERGVHIGDAAFHVQNPHAGGHGVLHGAAKSGFGDQGGLGGRAEARIAPEHQQADDDHAGQGQHHPDQALLAHFLVYGDKHDAVVMDALQPEEHRHHTDIEDQHHRGRDPVHAAPASAGVVVEWRRNIGLGRAGHGIRAG
ncbi:hypothetical protein D3C85_1129970 [compost metagenome]